MQDGITNRGWTEEKESFWKVGLGFNNTVVPNTGGTYPTGFIPKTMEYAQHIMQQKYSDINKPEVNLKNVRKQAELTVKLEKPIADISMPEVNIKNKVDPNNATRFDTGKADWSQVPFSALEGMVKVLEFGAKKYAKANWVSGGGFDHSRVLNSCMRHLFAYAEGQDVDPESGLSHIWHAQCNMLFLAHYKNHPEKFPKDDRIKFISEQ